MATIEVKEQYNYVKAGDINGSGTAVRRIVHISDTHEKHDEILDAGLIPDGDILVHSGDFTNYQASRRDDGESDYHDYIQRLDAFFARLPHKHKLFVPGNHEFNMDHRSVEEVQTSLKHGIYLQDRTAVLDGVKFWGAGWNGLRPSSNSRGFAIPWEELPAKWAKIPEDTDVVVTHNPPFGIMDCGDVIGRGEVMNCDPSSDCGHPHFGCTNLLETIVTRVRPRLHMFGHCHEATACVLHEGVVFCDGAVERNIRPVVADIWIPAERAELVMVDPPNNIADPRFKMG